MKNLMEVQGGDVKKIEIIKGWKGLMEQADCLTAKMASLTPPSAIDGKEEEAA